MRNDLLTPIAILSLTVLAPTAGAAQRAPLDIALDHVRSQAAALGVTAADLEELVVTDEYPSRDTGVTHVWLRQAFRGIEVTTSELGVHVAADGRVLHFTGRPLAGLAASIDATAPELAAEAAIVAAAEHLGLPVDETPQLLEATGAPDMAALYSGAGISREDIPVRLLYLPAGERLRLTWHLVIDPGDGRHHWSVWVDAETGAVLRRDDWVDEDPMEALVMPGRQILLPDRAPLGCAGPGTADYLVYALPKESPNDGERSCEVDPQDAVASPFGWHDTNGAPGPELTDTAGNNVFAQEDRDANNSGGFRPDGGPDLDFEFPLDLNQEPITYQAAAITNLFYWNNVVHDIFYRYGFDEPAGNFQENNYGNGGAASDHVWADAQDGSGTNNANFGTPPDGSNPRMQMFEWVTPFANQLIVNSPGGLGPYDASGAAFGPPPSGQTGNVTYVDDGVGPDVHDGCEPFGLPAGNVALIRRGNCTFVQKVNNAQAAGAVAAIIQKITPGNPITLGGTDPTIVIPSGMISMDAGNEIIAALGGGTVNVTFDVNTNPPPNRDSDLDNGVIVHEYTHGLSNRLTGGPGNVGCLQNAEQAGEGWSDWYALALTPDPADTATTPRGIGTYVSFEGADGLGIREFPYSTDLGVNPHTYGTLGACAGPPVSPHCVGERWAATVWELYWNLVEARGFDPDLYAGSSGNNLALRLVTDGLKLQPCSPSFVQGRDAILAADMALTGGDYQCQIWTAFAKRGVGFSASAGSNFTVGDEIEAFDLPPGLPQPCPLTLFADGFETGDTSAWTTTVN